LRLSSPTELRVLFEEYLREGTFLDHKESNYYKRIIRIVCLEAEKGTKKL